MGERVEGLRAMSVKLDMNSTRRGTLYRSSSTRKENVSWKVVENLDDYPNFDLESSSPKKSKSSSSKDNWIKASRKPSMLVSSLTLKISSLVVFLTGLALSFLTYQFLHDDLNNLADQQHQQETLRSKNIFQQSIIQYISVVSSLARQFGTMKTEFDVDDFRHLAEEILSPTITPGWFPDSLQGIGFNPYVLEKDRQTYVNKYTSLHPGLTDTPAGPIFYKPEGVATPHVNSSNGFYVPIHFLEPVSMNAGAFGFDIASSPSRLESIVTARDGCMTTCTHSINLVQADPSKGLLSEKGVLILSPSFNKSNCTAEDPHIDIANPWTACNETLQWRRENFLGVAVAVLNIEKMSQRLADTGHFDGSALVIRELDGTLLFGKADDSEPGLEKYRASELIVADKTWLLSVGRPNDDNITVNDGAAIGLPLAGLFVTFLTTVAVFLLGRHTDLLANLVLSECESERLRLTISGIADMMLILDKNKEIQWCNRSFEKVTGYKVSAIVGMPIATFVSNLPEELFIESDSNTSNASSHSDGPKSLCIDVEVTKKNGSVFPAELAFQSRQFNTVLMLRDLTLKNKMLADLTEAQEKEATAHRNKTDFLCFICHEVRNPLHAMSALVLQQLKFVAMARELLSTEMKNKLEIDTAKLDGDGMLSCVRQMQAIVDDVLNLEKIEAGKMRVESRLVDFKELMRQIQHQCIPKENVELVLECFPGSPPGSSFAGFTDTTRLSQVLLNLLSNAFKFTSKGKVVLSMSKMASPPVKKFSSDDPVTNRQKVKVRFSVRDTGRGISEEDLATLFKPYAQVHSDDSIKGTGLGLVVGQKLVKALGGELKIKSKLGQGSEFFFDLDLNVPDEDQKSLLFTPRVGLRRLGDKAVDQLLANHSFQKGDFVLLVEDVPINQKVAMRMLKNMPYEVRVSSNGSEGVEVIKKELELAKSTGGHVRCICVMMDMMMPIMNGFDATKKIRELKYNGPIIAMSGNIVTSDKERFMRNGGSSFICKPFSKQALTLIIAKFITSKEFKPFLTEAPGSAANNTEDTTNAVRIHSIGESALEKDLL